MLPFDNDHTGGQCWDRAPYQCNRLHLEPDEAHFVIRLSPPDSGRCSPLSDRKSSPGKWRPSEFDPARMRLSAGHWPDFQAEDVSARRTTEQQDQRPNAAASPVCAFSWEGRVRTIRNASSGTSIA